MELRAAIGSGVVGALLIWAGIAQHVWWLYGAGVLAGSFMIALIVRIAATRLRPADNRHWLVGLLTALAVAIPAILLPWWSARTLETGSAAWVTGLSAMELHLIDDRVYALTALRADKDGSYTYTMSVLDHRTGEVTGRWLEDPEAEVWTALPVAPGRALVLTTDGQLFSIGRTPT